jgi:hypothetical protein
MPTQRSFLLIKFLHKSAHKYFPDVSLRLNPCGFLESIAGSILLVTGDLMLLNSFLPILAVVTDLTFSVLHLKVVLYSKGYSIYFSITAKALKAFDFGPFLELYIVLNGLDNFHH